MRALAILAIVCALSIACGTDPIPSSDGSGGASDGVSTVQQSLAGNASNPQLPGFVPPVPSGTSGSYTCITVNGSCSRCVDRSTHPDTYKQMMTGVGCPLRSWNFVPCSLWQYDTSPATGLSYFTVSPPDRVYLSWSHLSAGQPATGPNVDRWPPLGAPPTPYTFLPSTHPHVWLHWSDDSILPQLNLAVVFPPIDRLDVSECTH